MTTHPPRLLAGATLIFWGGLTGHVYVGLLAALLLEAKSWVSLQWEFKHQSYVKAWHFSILLGVMLAALAWFNGMKLGKIHTLFVWAPLILLPLELTQRYGTAKKIPLNTFSFFARKKMERDTRQGRSVSPRMINTGYPYMAIVILATAMASRDEFKHFIGLSLVIAACLFFYVRKNSFRPLAWCSALLLVLVLSFFGQLGMNKIYNYYTGNQEAGSGRHTSANGIRTSIGKLGRLKLSPQIFWRMRLNEGNVPRLLRTATYNSYARATWLHEYSPSENRDDDDYIGPTDISVVSEKQIYSFSSKENIELPETANIRIIGELDTRLLDNPIPLPHFTLAIGDLGEETSLDSNSLGTVRMANPEYNVVAYSVWTGDYSTTEEPRNDRFDLNIPAQEFESVQRINKQLGLNADGLTTRDKIRQLRNFFNTEFSYSTHLNTPNIKRADRQSAVGIFLETTRSGHCEYFATATALLLRQTGVPTRYCVGFSVNERDAARDEWVMRGVHAHAWCRVWIDDHWEDVDLTPDSWVSMETDNSGLWQRKMADWWQRLREDFLIWRTRSTNKTIMLAAVSAVVTLLLLWISWRLWHSRQRRSLTKNRLYRRPSDAPFTALNKLEPLVSKKIGVRAEGVPLCKWLGGIALLDPAIETILTPATQLHAVIRFDPKGATPEQHQELAILTERLRRAIKNIPS